MPRLLLFRGRPSSWVWNIEEMAQRKDTLNKNQSHPFRSWRHGPLFFLHWFLRLVLLVLLYKSGKISIPHYHLFLLLHNLHLVLFKSLQRQGDQSISGGIYVVFCWDRDGNHSLSFLKRDDLPFVLNRSVGIYFWPISIRQIRNVVLMVLQQCGDDFVIISGSWTSFKISLCAIDLVYGAQCKCKRKQWFVFYALLRNFRVTDYFQISIVGNCLPRTWQGRWRGGR